MYACKGNKWYFFSPLQNISERFVESIDVDQCTTNRFSNRNNYKLIQREIEMKFLGKILGLIKCVTRGIFFCTHNGEFTGGSITKN